MIIVFFGDNDFISKRKLKETIKNYKKKHKSGLSLFSFSSDNFSFDKFKDAVETVSMFDKKKCIVLNELFSDGSNLDFLLKYFKNKKLKEDKDVFILIKEYKFFKKINANFELLLKEASMLYESKKFNNTQLKLWVKKEAEINKATITEKAIKELLLSCKSNLFSLSNEIAKLSSYDKKITESTVNLLVEKNIESDIFCAIEALVKKDKQKAVSIFYRQIKDGKRVSYLISMIAFQLRNMIKVKELLDRGFSFEFIVKKIKIHSFVLRKIITSLEKYSLDDLKNIYKKLLDTEIKVKSSKIDNLVILDNFILNI